MSLHLPCFAQESLEQRVTHWGLFPIVVTDIMEVDSRKNKAIPIEPMGILRVEGHEFVEHNVGNRCHTHWRSGMPGVGRDGGIDL